MPKTSAELFNERTRRVEDATQLKVPDRVPFVPYFQFFPARHIGVTAQDVMYDYEKAGRAWKETILALEPDMYSSPFPTISIGRQYEILDYKQLKWPGHGVDPSRTYQFLEGEYMTADEYDAFLADPSDFMLRTMFPRIFGALEPFKMLQPLTWAYYTKIPDRFAVFGLPEVAEALRRLIEAGVEGQKRLAAARSFAQEMKDLGFPSQFGASIYCPYDYIGDLLRGTRGIMIDMYRNPDKLLKAMEKVLATVLQEAIFVCKSTGVPRVFIPIHKGAEGFMSLEQFKTFFWPTLQRLMVALIEAGLTPCPFFEGDYGSRLEIMRDIPRGKAIYWFGLTDIFRAKEILGDRVCLRGNVPSSLLCTGTPQQVKDYCQKLIDVVGKGGGFMIDGDAALPDEARFENLKAMADFTREYGRYS